MPDSEKVKFLGVSSVHGESYYKEDIASLCDENPDFFMPDDLLYTKYLPGDRIYRYKQAKVEAVVLPEPENPYDPNALRVEIEDTLVGYIPRLETKRLRRLMSVFGFFAMATIGYGPYKEVLEQAPGVLSTKIEEDYDFQVSLRLYGSSPTPAPEQKEQPEVIKGRSRGLLELLSPALFLFVLFCAAAATALVLVWLYALTPLFDDWMSSAFPLVLGGGVTAGIIAFSVSSSLA